MEGVAGNHCNIVYYLTCHLLLAFTSITTCLQYIAGAEAKEEVAVVVVVAVEVGAAGEARASEWPEASLKF